MSRISLFLALGVMVAVSAAAGGQAQRRLGEAYDAAGVLKPDLSAPTGVVDDDLPKCGMATNCFDCFQQQECYANPFGTEPICSPCGWCTNGTSEGDSLRDDIKGLCAMAPTGIVDFCPWVEGADSHLYCPTTVCTVGDFGCSCAGNQCPATDFILGFLTLEMVYAICTLVAMSVGVLSGLVVRGIISRRRNRLSENRAIITSDAAGVSVVGVVDAHPVTDYARMG